VFAKLLTSLLLSAVAVTLLFAGPSQATDTRVLVACLAVVLLGWHRVLLPERTTSRWSGLWTPDRPEMHSVDTLWGFVLRPPRSARVSLRAQRLTEEHPVLARFIETLPVWLCRGARRLLTYRHNQKEKP
jgi:hypothetical protein